MRRTARHDQPGRDVRAILPYSLNTRSRWIGEGLPSAFAGYPSTMMASNVGSLRVAAWNSYIRRDDRAKS